jgi:hypothetical protein
MGRTLTRILIAAGIVVIAIQFVPIDRSNPAADPRLEVDASVAEVFRHACYDCHSQQAVWPWYSRIAPVSWLIANDVHEARHVLNLSLWQQYSARKKAFASGKAVEEIEEGGMPLPRYRRLHPAARVSAAELQRLRTWADSLHQADTGPARP